MASIKLNNKEKFLLQDDNGNMILVTEVEFDYHLLISRVIAMKGILFEIDYYNNTFKNEGEIELSVNFEFGCVHYPGEVG